MPHRFRRGRTLGIVAVVAGVAALAPVAVAQATVTTYSSTQWAAYSTNNLLKGASTVSTIVTVPTVSCAGVADGVNEGQDSVAQIASSTATGGEVLAGVRHYCAGDQPVYETTFVNSHKDTTIFTPGGVEVAPGQTVKLFVRVYGDSTTAKIINQSTDTSASSTMRGTVTQAYPYVGIVAIGSNGNGGVLESGSPPAGSPNIPGPVPAASEDFSDAKFNGQTLETYDTRNNLGLVQWDTSLSGGTVLAIPTAITSGSAFNITDTSQTPTVLATPTLRAAGARRMLAG